METENGSGGVMTGIDPEGFERRVSQYLEWMRVHHFSERTVVGRAYELARLVGWCAERGVVRPTEVTKPTLEEYQAALFHAHRERTERPLAASTQRQYLQSVRGFFKWLARGNHVLYNAAADLILPSVPKRLPREVLSASEAERVINATEVATSLGLRDRAILEVLYSTGMRRMELASLSVYDLDRERGTVMIRHGKGRRQRVVPIGDRALAWVEKYLAEGRPELVVPPDEGLLFLTNHGAPIALDTLTETVHGYVERARVEKRGAVHLFRHTCATLMLEGGADVRYVQEMLGHANLGTTQVYTHVSIQKLKEVHTASHPARLVAAARPTLEAAARPTLEAAARPAGADGASGDAEAALPVLDASGSGGENPPR